MKCFDIYFSSRTVDCVLCVVAETSGSCPGKAGFKMIVPPEGACTGSVGGGSMEHSVITTAREMLVSGDKKPRIVSFDHRAGAEPEEKSGMICSGSQKIILIPPSDSEQKLEGKYGVLVNGSGILLLDHVPEKTGFLTGGVHWNYTEELAPPKTVYIFGGGHCSLALTPVLNSIGLQVVIIDNRRDVWTMEENTQAWKRIVADYSSISDLVPGNGSALVVIMTASHVGDVEILKQMLPKKLRYLGMMASRTTGRFVFNEMRSIGFTDKELGAVHSPIGIPVGSRTPAEIAISIAAEIVKVLNAD
jgi:xanthine dehydrogenase accessory factor